MTIILAPPRGSNRPPYHDAAVEQTVDMKLYTEIVGLMLVGQDAKPALDTAVWIGRAFGKIAKANYLFRGATK